MIFQCIKDIFSASKNRRKVEHLEKQLHETKLQLETARYDLASVANTLEKVNQDVHRAHHALSECINDAKEMYSSNTVACIKYYANVARREDLLYAANFTEQIVQNTLSKTHILETLEP